MVEKIVRHTPAKGVDRATGARVQIPPAPPFIMFYTLFFLSKKTIHFKNSSKNIRMQLLNMNIIAYI